VSTTPHAVSRADARRALLRYQLAPGSLDEVVQRLGSVQVDPLAPMGRNHDLVLQARVDGYRVDGWQVPAYRDRSWVDAWDKQACLTLSADWPARRLYREHFAAGRADWLAEHADAVAATLARIESEGPRSSLGLEGASSDRLRGSWYGPRLVRHVLRVLWHTGQLVTREREAGRHVYDLPERVLPPAVLAAPPLDDDAALRALLLRRVQSAGALRRGADVSLWSLPVAPAARRAALAALVADGEIEAWDVEGVPYVALPRLREAAAHGEAGAEVARVLAPLDNLTWDRRGLRDLFGFDYLWEVYKPAGARRWGYYVVPVVLGDRFVARFDARRESVSAAGGREDARLRVHGGWWEEPRPTEREAEGLRRGLARFLRYLGADAVALPRGLDRPTRALWQAAVAEARA
jgi:uncharacterized protein